MIPGGSAGFAAAARRRILPYAIGWLLAWPVASMLLAALAIGEQSVARRAAPVVVFSGTALGALSLWPEFLAVASCAGGAALVAFALAEAMAGAAAGQPSRRAGWARWLEPLLALASVAVGMALEYPAVLRHGLLRPLRALTVGQATLALAAIVGIAALAHGGALARRRGAVASLALCALLAAGTWLQTTSPLARDARSPEGGVVLLGLDSLSHADDVRILQGVTRALGGTWHERAVTPALVTNAVWTSILMNRLPHETGVYLIYQSVDWTRAPWNAVAEARRRGMRSESWISCQFTSYVGTQAGFDVDRSSPLGWRYMATGFVKDASLLLPVVVPRLPPIPFAGTPRNQEGTFTYDLRWNIREILTAGGPQGPAFVAAHLDYLHATGYPRYSDLSAAETAAVRRAPLAAIDDQSLDPEHAELPGDPLGLARWKVRQLQLLVADELSGSDALARGRRVIVFSDHGARHGLEMKTLPDPRYWWVVLAAFGVPGLDPLVPVSLADMTDWVGLGDPTTPPHEPLVEHAAVSPEEAAQFARGVAEGTRGSRLDASGAVVLDPATVASVGQRLTAFRPAGEPRLQVMPATPAAANAR